MTLQVIQVKICIDGDEYVEMLAAKNRCKLLMWAVKVHAAYLIKGCPVKAPTRQDVHRHIERANAIHYALECAIRYYDPSKPAHSDWKLEFAANHMAQLLVHA